MGFKTFFFNNILLLYCVLWMYVLIYIYIDAQLQRELYNMRL